MGTGDPTREAAGGALLAPLSASEALRILNGRSRRGALTRDTTVWEAFGLGHWKFLSNGARRECLDDTVEWWRRLFGIPESEVDFDAVLWPPRHCTLGAVCDLIAAHAVAPRLDPPTEHQAFEAVVKTLAEDGADTTGVTADTPLEPYLREHRKLFAGPLWLLARGQFPPPDVAYTPAVRRAFVILTATVFLSAAFGILTFAFLGPVGLLAAGGAFLVGIGAMMLTAWLAQRSGRGRWHLGTLVTFGDLARIVAREQAQAAD